MLAANRSDLPNSRIAEAYFDFRRLRVAAAFLAESERAARPPVPDDA